MEALLLGVLGGAALALVQWVVRIPGQVRTHDRLIAERDEDLATWVADTHFALTERQSEILDELAAKNLLYSGQRLFSQARAKEAVLHAYRDQERQARRFVAELAGREELPHKGWRLVRHRRFPTLAAPDTSEPVLDFWRRAESYEGSPIREVDDPTQRTLDAAVRDAEARIEQRPPD